MRHGLCPSQDGENDKANGKGAATGALRQDGEGSEQGRDAAQRSTIPSCCVHAGPPCNQRLLSQRSPGEGMTLGGLPLRFLGKPLRGDGLIVPLRLRDGTAFPVNGEDRERALSLPKVPALLPGRVLRTPSRGRGIWKRLRGSTPLCPAGHLPLKGGDQSLNRPTLYVNACLASLVTERCPASRLADEVQERRA